MIVIKNYKPDCIDFGVVEELGSIDYDSYVGKIHKPCIGNREFDTAIKLAKGVNFYNKAIEQMQKLEAHVAKDVFSGLVVELFKGKLFEGLISFTTWRFTEMMDMNYHLDIYERSTLRCFYNLSDFQRHWRLGHHAFDIYESLIDEPKHEFIRALSNSREKGYIDERNPKFNLGQRRLNSILNELAENRCVNPFFDWMFDKYDLWIVDGRKAAHKPIWGDKLVAFDYGFLGVNNYELRNSSLCYPKWISDQLSL